MKRTSMLSIAMLEGSKCFRLKVLGFCRGLDLIWHAYAQTGWLAPAIVQLKAKFRRRFERSLYAFNNQANRLCPSF